MQPARKQNMANAIYEENFITEPKQKLAVVQDSKREPKAKVKVFSVKVRMVLVVLVIFSLALAYTAITAKITAYGYEVNNLKMAISEAESENGKLNLALESVYSPEQVALYAAENLDMALPSSSQVVYVLSDSPATDSVAKTALKTVLPSDQVVKVEVVDDSGRHPIWQALNSFLSNSINELF